MILSNMENGLKQVKRSLLENVELHTMLADSYAVKVDLIGTAVRKCLQSGNTVFFAGNGGSAAEASHIAAEYVGRFKKERRGLPSVALTADLSAITAIGNDYGFEHIFDQQIEALGSEGDVLILLSTSGNSQNLIEAAQKAKTLNLTVISLLGKDGGRLRGVSDIEIIIPSNDTARIQEAHLTILHIVCELSDEDAHDGLARVIG